MQFGRKKFIHVIAALALGTAGALAAAGPANAEPDIETVKAKVEKLQHEAEQASERYNDARVKAVELKTRLDALNADLKRQKKTVGSMRQQVASSVVDQFQGSSLSASTQMMLSDDPDAFLDNLNAVSTYNSQKGLVLGDYTEELERLELRSAAVEKEAKRLDKLQRTMLAEKKQVDSKVAEAEEVLDELEAEAREKLLAGEASNEDLPSVPAEGRAKAAVDFAMSQVGKAYVYGAAGPSAYDCSGLTMVAWSKAGVGLPHSSRAQQGSGRSVSEGELAPGDLVFYYSPVSHVGMYIGNGMIVHAANPGAGVRVDSLHSMPYVGAVRPG